MMASSVWTEECTAAIGFEEEPVADDEVRWLYRQLPELVRRGIVPPPVAAQLRLALWSRPRRSRGHPAPLSPAGFAARRLRG